LNILIKDKMMIPKIILSTGSLYTFDLDTTMALAAETGFDGVELMIDWRRETYHLPHLEQLVERHQLPIVAVHSPFAHMNIQGWPADPVGMVKQSVDLAEALGAQTVVVHPPGRWVRLQAMVAGPYHSRKIYVPLPVAGPGRLGRWLLEELPTFQAGTTVKVAVENMPCRRFGPFRLNHFHLTSPEQLRRFQYLTLDTTHVGTRQLDLLDFYQQLKGKVAHLHLSNFNGKEHQLPANGHLPLAELLAALVRDEYEGLVSLELGPASLQADDEAALRQNLQACLDFCRAALGVARPI
jgi:sugar phosphate isomerase/epimerase